MREKDKEHAIEKAKQSPLKKNVAGPELGQHMRKALINNNGKKAK